MNYNYVIELILSYLPKRTKSTTLFYFIKRNKQQEVAQEVTWLLLPFLVPYDASVQSILYL